MQGSSSVKVSPPFVIELLGSQHKRGAFACGVEPLDRYFREQAGQDARRRAAACYVAREIASDAIAGYYTLSAGSVLLTRMPQTLSKKLPRYPDVPVARLGGLAVGQKFQGKKLGAALLWDAIESGARYYGPESRQASPSTETPVLANHEAAEHLEEHAR